MRWILRSKIHKALVTQEELSDVGSITIDSELLAFTGLIPGEKVLVVSILRQLAFKVQIQISGAWKNQKVGFLFLRMFPGKGAGYEQSH